MKTKLPPCSPAILTLGLCLFLFTPAQGQRMPQDSWYLAKEFSIGGEPYFTYAASVALGPDGNFYATDSGNHQVKVLDPQGNQIRSWGMNGSGPGQMHYPRGIHVSQDGKVYVAEENHRIQVFDMKGTFLARMGMGHDGDDNGQLSGPLDVTSDGDGNVYVADTNNNRVMVFSPDGSYLRKWGSRGDMDGQFNYPCGIVITPEGLIAVLERDGRKRVQFFDQAGRFISYISGDDFGWEEGQLGSPQGMEIDGEGNFYITDWGWNLPRVKVFSPSWQFLRQFGLQSTEGLESEGRLNHPLGLTVVHDRVFVAEWHGHRIAVFDTQGNWVANWGSRGGGDDPNSRGVAIDALGNILISDFRKNIIEKFDRELNLLQTFGSPGTGPGQFQGALDLAVGPNGQLHALDQGGKRINVFDVEGNHVRSIGADGGETDRLAMPSGLAIDAQGRIYVSDREKHSVLVFGPDGDFLFSFGRRGSFDGDFESPRGIAIFPDGEIAVADHGNKRIQIFNPNGEFVRKKTFHEMASDPQSTLGNVGNDADHNLIQHLHVSPDGLLYAVADTLQLAYDGTKNLWKQGAVILVCTQQLEPVKGWFAKSLRTSEDGHNIYFRSREAVGPVATTPEGDLLSANGDRVGRLWKRTFRTVHPEPANALPLPTIVAQQRRPGTALVDVDYTVKDADNTTVQTAALAFKNGGNSLADLIPITSFAEGTGSKLGANIATGQTHRFTWDVARDWSTDFGEVQLEILAKDGRDLLNLDFIQLPASGDEAALKISRSPLTDNDFLSVWYWLIATGDPEIRLENGAIEQVGGQPKAAGLWGEYFQNTDFIGALVDQKLDESFSFSSGSGGFFSIRWTGEFVPVNTGQYTFRYGVDDVVSIWIGGEKVVSNNNPNPTFTVSATANVPLPIRIEYHDHGGWRSFFLNITPPGESERAALGSDFQYSVDRLASVTSTRPAGRAYILQKMGLREATVAEVTRAKEAGTPRVINQWDPKLRVGPDERPAKINAYGFDTGSDGYWVVPVNGN